LTELEQISAQNYPDTSYMRVRHIATLHQTPYITRATRIIWLLPQPLLLEPW